MTSGAAAPAVPALLAVAVALWPDGNPVGRRTPPSIPAVGARLRHAVVIAGGVLAAAVLLAPQQLWLAAPVATLVGWWAARREPGPTRADIDHERGELAVELDLIATCLGAGMGLAPAIGAVSATAGPGRPGPGGGSARHTLRAVGALLALGTEPRTAWRTAALHPDLASVAAAATRSAVGGTAMADALTDQADQLRRSGSAAARRSAGRAGVLMAAPLGVCFLPAFICLGLAPVVIGLIGRLGIF